MADKPNDSFKDYESVISKLDDYLEDFYSNQPSSIGGVAQQSLQSVSAKLSSVSVGGGSTSQPGTTQPAPGSMPLPSLAAVPYPSQTNVQLPGYNQTVVPLPGMNQTGINLPGYNQTMTGLGFGGQTMGGGGAANQSMLIPPSQQTMLGGFSNIPALFRVELVKPLPLPVTIVSGMPGVPTPPKPPDPDKERESGYFKKLADWLTGQGAEPELPSIKSGEKAGGFLGGMTAAGGRVMAGLGSSSELGGVGETMKGLGSAVGAVGSLFGPIGKGLGMAGESLLKFGGMLIESVDHLKNWGNSLHHANMQFAEFSGAMASVQARQELRDALLSRERGDRRAESAERLAEAKNRLERATAPIEDAWSKIQSSVFEGLAELITPGIELLNSSLRELRLLPKKEDKDRGEGGLLRGMAGLPGGRDEFNKFGVPLRHR